MAKYYALVSGLPDLTVDQKKPPFSSEELVEILHEELTRKDKKLLDILRLDSLCKKVVQAIEADVIKASDEILDDDENQEDENNSLTLPLEELNLIRLAAEEEQDLPKNKDSQLPLFLRQFVYNYYFVGEQDDPIEETGTKTLSLMDKMALAYYDYAEKNKDAFLSKWFTLNRNIRNILAAHTCRKLEWDPKDYIVGNTEIEQLLKTSTARDFSLGDYVDYIGNLLQIAEETDIAVRERQIDVLKWNWLEEETFARIFDIDSVLSYYIKVCILERWSNLNEQEGEKTFRSIVKGLKEESHKSLQQFKDKQRK